MQALCVGPVTRVYFAGRIDGHVQGRSAAARNNSMDEIQGKMAFVTGGASGIGLGIAKVFVNAGMKVIIADLRQDHLDSALAYFAGKRLSGAVHGICLDVTDRAALAAAADDSERRFGNIHVVVNNAGVGLEGPLSQVTYNDWDFGVGVNLGGVINGVQTFLPRIRRHGEGGHIVNTASLAGLVMNPAWMIVYATAKAAVIALTESLRTELERCGVGVSVLIPGPTKSNIHEAWRNRPERFQIASGYQDAEDRLSRRQVPSLWMEPELVGDRVLKGIRSNELYIITHGEARDAFLQRMEAILAAMPKEINPDLIASFRDPLQNT
jgi:NAD(P)-dependent dehydrogenase (short-subunit alcohol dehydrogenase family)